MYVGTTCLFAPPSLCLFAVRNRCAFLVDTRATRSCLGACGSDQFSLQWRRLWHRLRSVGTLENERAGQDAQHEPPVTKVTSRRNLEPEIKQTTWVYVTRKDSTKAWDLYWWVASNVKDVVVDPGEARAQARVRQHHSRSSELCAASVYMCSSSMSCGRTGSCSNGTCSRFMNRPQWGPHSSAVTSGPPSTRPTTARAPHCRMCCVGCRRAYANVTASFWHVGGSEDAGAAGGLGGDCAGCTS